MSRSGNILAKLGPPLGEAAVGRRIKKRFGREHYHGTVAEYIVSKKWYLIRYDDGDSEDLTWKALVAVLVDSNGTDSKAGQTRSLPLPSPPKACGAKGKERLPGGSGSSGREPPTGPAGSKEPLIELCHDPQLTVQSVLTAAVCSTGQEETPACGGSLISNERGGAPGSPAVEQCITKYNQLRLEAVASENERLQSSGGVNPNGKKQSRRPDLVAMTKMREGGHCLGRAKVAGEIPGIPIGFRFWSRAEMAVTGTHFAPVAGIEYVTEKERSYVVSIVVSGNYEGGHGDENATAGELIYDGAGGCDLLHSKRQIADQVLDRGNLAFTFNHKLQIPIRVTRKHQSKQSYTKSVFTYDGLWDVVEWWGEKPQTDFNPGFLVYRYRLRRRPGQPVLDLMTKAQEKAANDRHRQEAKKAREAEKERRAAAEKLAKETKAALVDAQKAFTQATVGSKRRLSSADGNKANASAPIQKASKVGPGGQPSDQGAAPGGETAVPLLPEALVRPPHPLRWPGYVSLALSVSDFLKVFDDLVIPAEEAGTASRQPAKRQRQRRASPIPFRCHVLNLAADGCDDKPVGWNAVEEWLLPLYTALLPQAVTMFTPFNRTGTVRMERWSHLLESPVLACLEPHLCAAVLLRCCEPLLASSEPLWDGGMGAPLECLNAGQHISLLSCLCNVLLGAPELHSELDRWVEERQTIYKELNAWNAKGRRQLLALAAEERQKHQDKLAASLEQANQQFQARAPTESMDLETLRQRQREAKEQADLEGKLRTDSQKSLTAIVAEAEKEFLATHKSKVDEAERKVAAMPLRRQPLGSDRDGQAYWWLPQLPASVLVQRADGEWMGYFDAESLPLLVNSLDKSNPCEQQLGGALRQLLDSSMLLEASLGGEAEDGKEEGADGLAPRLLGCRAAEKTATGDSSSVSLLWSESPSEEAAACVTANLWRLLMSVVYALEEENHAVGPGAPSQHTELMELVSAGQHRVRASDLSAPLLEMEDRLSAALKPPKKGNSSSEELSSDAEDSDRQDEVVDDDAEESTIAMAERSTNAIEDMFDELYSKAKGRAHRKDATLWADLDKVQAAWRLAVEGAALCSTHVYLAAALSQCSWPLLKARLAKARTGSLADLVQSHELAMQRCLRMKSRQQRRGQ